jgi:hypothetical protein
MRTFLTGGVGDKKTRRIILLSPHLAVFSSPPLLFSILLESNAVLFLVS